MASLNPMSEITPDTRSAPYVELRPLLWMVPCERGSVAFADEVRRAMFLVQPTHVMLEFPRAFSVALPELLDELPRINLLAWKAPTGKALYLPADPCDAVVQAARFAVEWEIPIECVDGLEGESEDLGGALPDSFSLSTLGVARYFDELRKHVSPPAATDRERRIERYLLAACANDRRVLYVGSLRTGLVLAQLATEPSPIALFENHELQEHPYRILPIGEDQLSLVIREMPMLCAQYDRYQDLGNFESPFPVFEAIEQIIEFCADRYEDRFEEQIGVTQRRALLQYMRNLAFVRGQLRPAFHELVTAAKSCVDGDFGALCYELLSSYPPNADYSSREEDDSRGHRHRSLELHGDLGDGLERLQCAFPVPTLGEVEYTFKCRKRVSLVDRERWRREFGQGFLLGSGICSWPPEDEFVERFFDKVRRKAKDEVIDRGSSVEEFTTSMLDGLDLRETMRNFHRETIFVRRERTPMGNVGPVVVIWNDYPLHDTRHWKTTLYAENQNESDIAFYSTMPGDDMVGPGISRLEYQGILSIYPAMGIPDVWQSRFLAQFNTCSRLLTAAAVILSTERYIAVVSPKPPDADLKAFARAQGRELLHLQPRAFPRAMLKKARRSHLLAGRNVRGYAGDYIEEL